MRKSICTVLVLVFVGTVAIGGGNPTIYTTSSPTLGAIAAGQAIPAEARHPRWFSWRKFWWGMAAAAVVWLSRGSTELNTPYVGLTEAIFD